MIFHGHVWVDGRKVTIPGYLMQRGEEEKIAYNGASPFNNELHPLRVDAPKVVEARARRLAREARREREDDGRGGGRGGRGGGGRGFPRKASRVMEKVKEVADVVAADVPANMPEPTPKEE
jgi:ribosomal protein S4